MASQRLTIATLAGAAADAFEGQMAAWHAGLPTLDPIDVDRLCESIRSNATSLHLLYFTEWIDRWLMGDRVPGPNAFEGVRFQVARFTHETALEWAKACGTQHAEHEWLAARLREAASVGEGKIVIVCIREVFSGSATDHDIQIAMASVPPWLARK